MAKPKKNVKSKIKKVEKPKKVKTPTKSKKSRAKPKKEIIKTEDNSYEKLSTIEPMFGKELKEEIIEQVHTEIELEEKNTMLKMAKSIVLSTILTIVVYFLISILASSSLQESLPVLIVIWIIITLLAYLFQTN